MTRLQPGQIIAPLRLTNLASGTVSVPSADSTWVHLQFRRFAGCPICNLHLRQIAQRHGELVAAGIKEVAVFHSAAETMRPYQGDLPFAVVADPEKVLYRQFGVESSLRSVADPRAWGAMVRGMLASHPSSGNDGEGGHLGLPAEFLVDAAGRIAACKYGAHASDHWSVDELLTLARKQA